MTAPKENHPDQPNKMTYPQPVKRPLGRILLDGSFIEQEALDAALAEQIKTNRLLGDVLLDMGYIDRAELDAVLWVQRDFANVRDAVAAAAGIRRMLGELLLSARLVNQEQLDFALEEQKKPGKNWVKSWCVWDILLPVSLRLPCPFKSGWAQRPLPPACLWVSC